MSDPSPPERPPEIEFASTLDPQHRRAVESLFFFNPRQSDYFHAIRESIDTFGLPALRNEGGRIWIGMPDDASQCLFAIDPRSGGPLGVVLYDRPVPEVLRVVHLAISAASQPRDGERTVAQHLVDRLASIARTIRGIDRIQLPYQSNRFLRLRRGTD